MTLSATVSGDSISPPENAGASLSVRELVKSYRLGETAVEVLNGVSLEVRRRELVAIMGPSGSGKTTLLNCIAAIDTPDRGTVAVAGEPVAYASEAARTELRRRRVGIVFQFFNLIPTLSVRENVALPLLIAKRSDIASLARVDALIERIGLARRAGHAPHQLSGGEMQLVSLARALVHAPPLLLADEPTGNVNPAIGVRIMETLRDMARDEGAGVLYVTHSAEHAAWADRICFLSGGVIAAEIRHDGARHDVTPIYERLLELGI